MKEFEKSAEIFLSNRNLVSDLDGPRSDIHTKAIEIANEHLEKTYQVSDVREFNAVRGFALAEGWLFDDAFELERLCYYDKDNLMATDPTKGAVKFSLRYYDRGKIIPTLTSRDPVYRDVTFAWHEIHFPWMDIDNDVLIRQKDDVIKDGHVFKALMIQKIGFDLLFEDSPFQAQFVHDYTEASLVYVSHLETPRNINSNRVMRIGSADGIRAADLSSLEPILDKITV